ncbi:MAG: hypothetical protein IKA79_04330, partial [Lentisphaeria bacterium]|nr:hypothetical protein [Lentisphaeria bacterium]
MKNVLMSVILLTAGVSALCGEIKVRTQDGTPHEQLAARELKYYGNKLAPSGKKFFLATADNKSVPTFIVEKLKKSPHKEAFYIYTLPDQEILIAGKNKWG